MIQSHEIKIGLLSFQALRFVKNSSIGPYAVTKKKGRVTGEGAEVQSLQKVEGGRHVLKTILFVLTLLRGHSFYAEINCIARVEDDYHQMRELKVRVEATDNRHGKTSVSSFT